MARHPPRFRFRLLGSHAAALTTVRTALAAALTAIFCLSDLPGRACAVEWRVAPFSTDITIPIGHACMGGGVADAKEILDPLFARGFVLLGDAEPIVVVALDWCQCNNDSFDQWRDLLAEAAGTTRGRVMLATVHQHDAPICDLTAQKLLDAQGLAGYNCDPQFHEKAVRRTAAALKQALAEPRRVTHFGIGQAEVKRVASNRRVINPQGKVTWERGSYSGDIFGAPPGEIDPGLKTISFWDGETPVLAWSEFAVHPMSTYGRGQVSADFPGLARARRQEDDPKVFQIYFTGCAGDVTAGKYNDHTPQLRQNLADRLYQAMVAAWKSTRRVPLEQVVFRRAELRLPVRDSAGYTVEAMQQQLADPKLSRWQRISAALGLSWAERTRAGEAIDVPCLELNGGAAEFVIMPAETFVGYQLAAERLRAESFVMVAGFGDGAPGYIPTDQCWRDGYDDVYCWVAPMVEKQMMTALRQALGWPELPDKNGSVELPAQEWPLRPGPRTAKVWIHYPAGWRDKVHEQTGLMLSLHNAGGNYSDGTANPQALADRLNVVAICVNYLQSGALFDGPEPYDLGYLQALDALRALQFVQTELQRAGISFDNSRIFTTGGSGGGNVSLMCNKLAPRTFACLVDMCGVTKLSDDIAFDLPGGSSLNLNYSKDKQSPYYLSPDKQQLRFVGQPEHLKTMKELGNSAKVIVVHGTQDDVCPTAEAQEMVDNMSAAGLDVEPHFITPADLDGRVLTSAGHPLGNRTEIVFRFADKYLSPGGPEAIRRKGLTDFERPGTEVRYATPGGAFVISYADGFPVGRFEPAAGLCPPASGAGFPEPTPD